MSLVCKMSLMPRLTICTSCFTKGVAKVATLSRIGNQPLRDRYGWSSLGSAPLLQSLCVVRVRWHFFRIPPFSHWCFVGIGGMIHNSFLESDYTQHVFLGPVHLEAFWENWKPSSHPSIPPFRLAPVCSGSQTHGRAPQTSWWVSRGVQSSPHVLHHQTFRAGAWPAAGCWTDVFLIPRSRSIIH